MAKKIPGKEEFYETLRYFKHRLAAAGVDVRLETAADAAQLKADGFESVVVATGVAPRTPAIEGVDHPKVVSYVDVLQGRVTCGAKVAVVGAGGIGFDVSEFLIHPAHAAGSSGVEADAAAVAAGEKPAAWPQTADYLTEWGIDGANEERGGLLAGGPSFAPAAREVALLQRTAGKVGAGLGKTTGWIHRANLTKRGVTMLNGCSYEKIDDDGLHVTVPDRAAKGEPKKATDARKALTLDVDTIVICAGQDPLDALKHELKDAGVRAFVVGGAERAGELDAKRAIDQGTRLAACIEDAAPGSVYEAPIPLMAKFVETAARYATSGRK